MAQKLGAGEVFLARTALYSAAITRSAFATACNQQRTNRDESQTSSQAHADTDTRARQ